MKIKKRDGRLEQLSIDKIIYRLKKLKNDVSLGKLTTIDTDPIALKIVSSIYDGVSSSELDEETARISISMTENLEYAKLASRIIVSNLHKNTSECFSDNMEKLYNNVDSNGVHAPVLSDAGIEFIRQHKDIINETCNYTRDYIFDYFGFKTLEKSYLMKLNGKVIERPQHLYMRVAIQVNLGDIDNVIKTYNIISQHLLTFASPTMFNSLGRLGNLSSCFHEDTIVATTNRGPIKIKDVQIGDSVITHLGNVKKVLQLHKNLLNDRKLYNVEIAKTAPIKVTDNHKVWTISPKKVIKDKKQRVCYDLDFVYNFLNEKGVKLLSTEYKNMKTKLQIECICKNITNVSFENIYYNNQLCNDRECIYNRNKFKSKNVTEPHRKSIKDLQNCVYIGIPNKLQESDNIKILDTLLFTKLLENKEQKITFEHTDTYITLKTHWEHNNWDKLNGESIKCSKEHSSINRFWNINNDFAKFVGIFYGDGHIMTSNKNIIRGIGITIHDINSNLIDFCKIVGKNIFGIEPTIHIVKNQNIIQVLYNSTFVGEIFKECFGKGFNGKFIWNEMYSWNKSMVLSLLEGLVTTDGCVSKNDCMSLQMSNVKFMRQMYYLLRNNNIDTSYGKENRAKKGTENHIQINIPISEITKQNINKYYSDDRMETDLIKKCRNQYSPIEVNGFKFLKFEKKTQITENLPEYVYTLGVEDDHSYNVGGIIAENCFLIGTSDSIGGIFKTMGDVAQISKVGGGIGLHIDNIRGKGAVIRGTNGHSDGIIPMLKVYNEISTYVNQCFTPDTWVYSKNGPKQMKDITTNDNLITIDGTFKKVNEVIINKIDKEILEIRATNTLFPVKVTKEHELYLLKDQKKITNYSVIKNRLEKGIIKPDFYNASELTENDLVGFPIPKYELDNDINDLDYYKFYGMMLGDGHICNGRNEYGITLGNETKSDLKTFVKTYLDKHNVHYWECENETECSSIRWSGNESLNLTRDMLYDNLNQKIIKDEFLHLPKNKIMKVLEGLLRTDGSNLKELAFTNSSQKLIMQMRYLFLRIGVLTSGCVKDNIGKSHVTKHGKTIITKQLSYYLRIPKHPNLASIIKFKQKGQFFKYFEWNGMLWGRIKSINTIKYQGDVYDFNMIDNHNYLTDMGLVHNSGKRKGSFAIYLSPSHPDIMEFLDLRKNQGIESLRARDLFYAMWIPDLFMEQLKIDGDWYLMDPDECPGLNETYGEDYEKLYWKYVEEKKYKKQIKAQEIWIKILESQIETGNPYILYKDQINKKSNQKNIGVIKSSNLCVSPETMILTSNGYYKIKELEGQNIKIWNGEEFTNTIVQKTGEDQELIKIKFSNGSELECTPYHKFYIATGKRPSDYPMIRKIDAKDLTKNMKLIKSEFPIIKEGLSDFPYPYEHGIFSADGTLESKKDTIFQCNYKSIEGNCYCGYHIKMYEEKDTDIPTIYCKGIVGKGNPRITLYGEKKKLVKYITSRLEILPEDNGKRINIRLPMNLKPKFEVPINYNLDIKLRWLEGLSDGDGCIRKSDKLTGIQISSIDKEFLENVKYLLQTLGCDPKIVLMHEEGLRLLPSNDGTDELSEYNCQTCYRLLITSWDTSVLYKLGFRPKRLNISGIFPKNNTKRWIQVENIIKTNRISDTFCFKEEKRGMGIFNGILTGQCAEITLYSDDKQYAVCNLSSVALPKFIKTDKDNKKYFDHQELFETVKYLILPMNNVIDFNYYPVPETKLSNLRHRPIGIGTQGWSLVLTTLGIPFESEQADKLNKEIWETMYFGSLTGSMELAKKDGPYETFKGSPLSEGKFQFDLWAEYNNIDPGLSGRWDWEDLRKEIITHGVRNSTLLSQMPTASSASIMNNTESVECFDSCIYKRRVLSGEYVVCNKSLVKDLTDLNLWNKELKDLIIANNGSVQNIDIIPQNIKDIYKTVWEISMKSVINQAASRGVFMCQTQSMNLFVSAPTIKKLSSMHMYAYSKHLKTGMYYLRSKSAANSAKFSIEPTVKTKENKTRKSAKKQEPSAEEVLMCSINNREACDLCTS